MRERTTRVRLLGGAVAIALTGCAVLASVGPASAQWRGPGWDYGYGPAAFAAGVIGGTVAAVVTSPLWVPGYPGYYAYNPGYVYGPTYAAPGYYAYSPGYAYRPAYGGPLETAIEGAAPNVVMAQSGPTAATVASCEARFRSYNLSTGMYTGYDGQQHPCP